jgi:hypothetical protein
MKLRMDSYLALTVETGESRARKNEVGALGATDSINELMPSHAPLGSFKRPNAGLVSCTAVVTTLVESAGHFSGRNKIGWICI